MQRSFFKPILSAFVLVVAGTLATAFSSHPGADSYEIRLNNKVLLKQFVGQAVSVKSLSLTEANAGDELTVYYSHCGVTGKGRSLSVKDDKDRVVKTWNYRDAEKTSNGMVIPVKELLALEKKTKSALQLHYAAKELPGGRMLTSLQFKNKDVAKGTARESWPSPDPGSVLRMIP